VYDQGEYTCVAENSLGKEQVVASLTLIPDPTYRRSNSLLVIQFQRININKR
jgi:hypothetical protein